MSTVQAATPTVQTEDQARGSTAALITYAILASWLVTKIALFWLAWSSAGAAGHPAMIIESAMIGLLGQVLTTEQTLLVACVGYWVGSSQSSKTAQANVAQIAAAASAPSDPKDRP